MIFLTVLIVFGLVQIWGSGKPLQHDEWFYRIQEMCSSAMGAINGRRAAVVVAFVLVAVVQGVLHGALFGLLELAFSVAVVLYSLGRGDLNEAIVEYMDCWQRGDEEGAYLACQKWLGKAPDVDNKIAFHGWVRREYLYLSFERWFAVLFWFLVLGPAGAVAYRVSQLTRNAIEDEAERGAWDKFMFYIEWLPVRLLGLTFAVVGEFVEGLDMVKQKATCTETCSADLLDNYAISALRLDNSGLSNGDHADITNGLVEWEVVQDIIHRSVVLWLVAFALIQLL